MRLHEAPSAAVAPLPAIFVDLYRHVTPSDRPKMQIPPAEGENGKQIWQISRRHEYRYKFTPDAR